MPQSGMHVVKRLPPAAVLSDRIRKRMKRNLTPLASKHALLRQRLVSGWRARNRPLFVGKVVFGREDVAVTIVIVNGEKRVRGSRVTVALLWLWWETTGTKPHKIRGNPLAFMMDGIQTFATVVSHPGTTPKLKTPAMNKRLIRTTGFLLHLSVREGLK